MTTIQYKEGQNSICNPAGRQLHGNSAMNLDGGLNPRELLEAAIGLCVSLTLASLLQKDEQLHDDTELSVQVTAFKDEGVTNRFSRFEVEVQLPATVDAQYGEKLLLMAERGCTIGNTVKAGAVIDTKRV